MNLENIQNCNRQEKVAILKLIVKIASADGTISEEEQTSIEEFTNTSNLKTSPSFIQAILEESVSDIVAVFASKPSIKSSLKVVEEYADLHSVHPELEGKVLSEITQELELRTKGLKFSTSDTLRSFIREFATLWGQESIRPELKLIWALIFVVFACAFGSVANVGFIFKDIEPHVPEFEASLSGLAISLALSARGFLPLPNCFRNLLFFLANTYLLALVSQYIYGDGGLEETITLAVFGGAIAILWLGMKELVGIAFLVIFVFLIYKIRAIDGRMLYHYPFIMLSFLGIAFQSEGFLPKAASFANSFLKTPGVDKEIVKESLKKTSSTITKTVKLASGNPF